ncbi:MAG: SURF1 family protein, partial [Gemmatimonadota bacterium]|nr:SURF1 family protein [Gemmatimonadota bacterium]
LEVMSRRNLLAVLIAIVTAAVCVRLGMWQLHRLAERRAQNAVVVGRTALAPVAPAESLPRYRRVVVSGTWDFDHELAIAGRTHGGSPGVNIVTPLTLAGSDRVVLVNRGWVYSPDAGTIDLTKWHEPDPVSLPGYVDRPTDRKTPSPSLGAHVLVSLDLPQLISRQPRPAAVLDYIVVALPTADSSSLAHPARLALPPLDEGPHQSYAVQWFSFATIAVLGVGLLLYQEGRTRRGLTPVES